MPSRVIPRPCPKLLRYACVSQTVRVVSLEIRGQLAAPGTKLHESSMQQERELALFFGCTFISNLFLAFSLFSVTFVSHFCSEPIFCLNVPLPIPQEHGMKCPNQVHPSLICSIADSVRIPPLPVDFSY